MAEHRLARARYVIRDDIDRRAWGELCCPLGVFPCEPDERFACGYTVNYLTGAGADLGDQYEYRIQVSSERLGATFLALFDALVPEEAHAFYEEFSFDAYRETDSYMSDEALPRQRLRDAWDAYGSFFCEDGKCGFGVVSYEPMLELILEEHGAIHVAVGIALKAHVEQILDDLGLEERESLKCIDNFDHQHRDILYVDPDDPALMDELDIKFSVLESLGMHPTNREEGRPPGHQAGPYWVHVELDLSFAATVNASGAFISFGVSAENHDQALALVEAEILKSLPGALVARVIEFYRMTPEDVGPDIFPGDAARLHTPGVWYQSEVHYWTE